MLSNIINKEKSLHKLLESIRPRMSPDDALLHTAKAWSESVWDEAERLGAMHIEVKDIEKGLALIRSGVFICGVHRSGTTLVRDLLDGHPDLVVLPSEGSYYTNLERKLIHLSPNEQLAFLTKEWLRRMANPINQPPYWILGRTIDMSSPYISFARYCISWWNILSTTGYGSWPHLAMVLAYANCTGNLDAKMWVDKTPNNEIFLQRIWKEMPHAKIIYVMRDPNDIFSSRKKLEPCCRPLNILRDMGKSLNTALENIKGGDNRFTVIRYEDITAGPVETMMKLATFLRLPFLGSLNTPTVAGIATSANSSFLDGADPGKILSGRQRETKSLTSNDRKFLIAFTGKKANRLQYSLEEMNPWVTWYWKFRAIIYYGV